jgi:hypothetical protein
MDNVFEVVALLRKHSELEPQMLPPGLPLLLSGLVALGLAARRSSVPPAQVCDT